MNNEYEILKSNSDVLRELAREPGSDLYPADPHRVLKMRCPTCTKLYSVEESWVDSPARAPLRFECVSCKTRFEAKRVQSQPTILETFEIPVRVALRAVPATRECPKCGVDVPFKAEECQDCGIVFAKYKPTDELSVGEIRLEGHRNIYELWDEVLAHYGDEAYHERFVMACYEANTLAFAAQKYARILSASGAEETARKMRKRIISLASFKTEIRGSSGVHQFRVPLLLNLILVLAGAATTVGLMLPRMKILTGLGLATIALALVVRAFLGGTRRPTRD